MNYITNIKKLKKDDIFVVLNKKYYLIDTAIKKGASKIICDIKYSNKKVKKVKNIERFYSNKILKQNKYLSKFLNIIVFINNENRFISNDVNNYLRKKKENVILLKNDYYLINNRKFINNENIDIYFINKILHVAYEKHINYMLIDINDKVYEEVLNLNISRTCLYDINNNHIIIKLLKKSHDKCIINASNKENIKLSKTIINKILIGQNGNFTINNRSFEYEYNNYKIINIHSDYNEKVYTYAILKYLGYDINDIIKRC